MTPARPCPSCLRANGGWICAPACARVIEAVFPGTKVKAQRKGARVITAGREGKRVRVEHRALPAVVLPIVDERYRITGGFVRVVAQSLHRPLAREVGRWADVQRFPREAWEA